MRMKIKRLILGLLLVGIMTSCSDSDSSEKDVEKMPSTAFEELLADFGLFNTSVKYESYSLGVDTNTVYFNGRVKDKLIINGFNRKSKTNIYSYEGLVLDTIIDVDEGYGVISNHQITNFSINSIHKYGDDCSFILWGWTSDDPRWAQKAASCDLYIVSGQMTKTKVTSSSIPQKEYYFNIVSPWFENAFMVQTYCDFDIKSKWRCFTMDGVEHYEVDGRYMGNDRIPINLEECIYFSSSFKRVNYKSGKTIWESEEPLTELPADIRIDKVEFEQTETDFVVCIINYTLENGIKGERKYNVDIATGAFTKI